MKYVGGGIHHSTKILEGIEDIHREVDQLMLCQTWVSIYTVFSKRNETLILSIGTDIPK